MVAQEHLSPLVTAEYYAQRASAGIILTEAIGISRQGLGWPVATGLWSRAQVDGWRRVTDAVHAAGGAIVAQLWRMGRPVRPSFLDGNAPVSSSATTAPGFALIHSGKQPYTQARALDVSKILALLEDFEIAAANAKEAGFDGVQLHAANGYLVDQFLRDSGNFRTDDCGGSMPNRMRRLQEVTVALIRAIGPDRTSRATSEAGVQRRCHS